MTCASHASCLGLDQPKQPFRPKSKSVFGSMVAVAFQSVFHSEKLTNNIFYYFLKIIFEISTSKWFENIKNILI